MTQKISPEAEVYVETILGLHARFTPHSGQVRVGRALINGHSSDIFIEAGRNFGKAQSLDTKLPTPDGWVTMGDIKPGQVLFDETGAPCAVTQVHPILHNRRVYELEFSCGTKVKACSEHLWLTWDKSARKALGRSKKPVSLPSVKTTEQIAKTLRAGKEYNHSIPQIEPLITPEASLPIHPYLLGLWLADGSTDKNVITKPYVEVWDHLASLGYTFTKTDGMTRTIYGTIDLFRGLNLLGNKHIPPKYLRSSIEQRFELMRGLLDGDGTCGKDGTIAFSSKLQHLRDQVFELAASLGYKPYKHQKMSKLYGVEHGLSYGLCFQSYDRLFYVKHKIKNQKRNKTRLRHHTIVNAVEIPSEPVRCITVDSPSQLFLCSESMIPTHNTLLVSYLLWRWARLNPGSENYYFAPFMKQAREIIWAPRILQNFGPREWIHDENNTEMRVPFRNGSFIKADGSDNVNAYRGVKPKGLIVFDEFKDFREEFYDAFDPNRAAFGAPLVIIGTPPDRECQFTRVRDAFKADPKKSYFHAPTHENPHISRDWLEAKRLELESRGESDVWQREYLALQIAGGQAKIFPMLKRELIVVEHQGLDRSIARDKKRLEYLYFCDPAAASVFGVLFAAYNPYTKALYVLDEIYETSQGEMTVRKIGQRILDKKNELNDRAEWRGGYDEAATWFQSEMLDSFGEHLEPSMKASNDKDSGLTLIKDMMLHGKLFISSRCEKLFWELDNYYKGKNGDIPKKNDHCIDALRYIIAALHYSLQEEAAPQALAADNRDKLDLNRLSDEW